jgi:hypothetical protein
VRSRRLELAYEREEKFLEMEREAYVRFKDETKKEI